MTKPYLRIIRQAGIAFFLIAFFVQMIYNFQLAAKGYLDSRLYLIAWSLWLCLVIILIILQYHVKQYRQVPVELIAALNQKPDIKQKFDLLSRGYKQSYSEWINSGHTAEVKKARIEKIIQTLEVYKADK